MMTLLMGLVTLASLVRPSWSADLHNQEGPTWTTAMSDDRSTEQDEEAQGEDDDKDDNNEDDEEEEAQDNSASRESATEQPSKAASEEIHARVQVEEARRRLSPRERRFGAPLAVSTMDLDEDLAPGATLADVLGGLAGVHVRQFGGPGDPSTVSLRGSTARQVEIWIDGVPLNSLGSSVIDLSELPVDSWDQLDVFRGFAPPELGGAPIGGVVHLSSKPGRVRPFSVEAGIGSWATRFLHLGAGSSRTTPGGGLVDVRLDARYDGTRGDFRYLDNQGTIYNLLDDRTRFRANNARDQLHLAARSTLFRGPLVLNFSDLLLWRGEGVPGPAHGSTEQARFTVMRNLASVSAKITPSSKTSLHLSLSHIAREERFRDLYGEIGPGTSDSRDRYHQLTGATSAQLHPVDWLALIPAVRLVVDTYAASNRLLESTTATTQLRVATELGFSAKATFWAERISLLSGLSFYGLGNHQLGDVPYQDQTTTSEGIEWGRHFQPRIAIAFRPKPWLTLRSSLARGFRPPTYEELFGQHGTMAGNPWLLPESSESADLSLRVGGRLHKWLNAGVEMGGFLVFTRDAIVYRPNAFRVAAPTNFGRIRVGGIELAGSAQVLGWLHLTGAATFVDSEILEGETAHLGNQVPATPRWQLDASVAIELDHHLKLRWQFAYTDGTFDSPTNLFRAAPRPIHSLHLRVQPDIRFPWVALDLRNLLDTTMAPQYRNPTNPDPQDRHIVSLEDFRGNPLPGRSVLITVGWSPPRAEGQQP